MDLGRSRLPAAAIAAVVGLIALGTLAVSVLPAGAALPGRNGRIAFVSDRNGTSLEVFTMDPDGRRARQLTHIGLDGAYEPAFSPRGKRVAFVTNRDGYKILTIGADGKHQRPLPAPAPHRGRASRTSPPAAGGSSTSPTATRTGTSRSSRPSSTAPGGASSPTTPFTDGDPAYSPDGRRIVFYSDRDGDEEIFVMRADGTHQRQLTHNTMRHRHRALLLAQRASESSSPATATATARSS